MERREHTVRPKIPDILTKQFKESVHPYTMMFLYLSYEQGAYKNLTELQREIFDRYYTDGLTIEGQYDFVGRHNLENIIISGFSRIRSGISEELNVEFRVDYTPKFKLEDRPYISDEEKIIIQKAKMSLTRKGRIVPKKTRKKMSESMLNWLSVPENKQSLSTRQKGRVFSAEHRRRLKEAKIRDWNDSKKKKKMLKALAEGRRKARERRLAEQSD